MNQQLDVPAAVCELAERLESAGFETWTVGGAVRDGVRGSPAEREDWDLATRATPAQMRRIFSRTVPLGPEYGTIGVFGSDAVLYEVTTFRHDVVSYGRKATVAFAETVEEDLSRRDFTINAMAWHPLEERLLDPHGGLRDLEDGVLRAVGDAAERFREDYLRVLRGLRFAGVLDLTIEPATWAGLTRAVPGLAGLSRERIREELVKVLAGSAPSRTLRLYGRSGALERIFGSMRALAPPALATVDALAGPDFELPLAVVLLCGQGAPGDTAAVAELLTRLRFSRSEVERIVAVVRGGLGPDPRRLGHAARRRRWVAEMGRDRVRDVCRVWEAALAAGTGPGGEELTRGVVSAVRRDERRRIPVSVGELAVAGRDLVARGWEPGPGIGEALRRLLETVWEDGAPNRREDLLEVVAAMEEEGP